VLFDYPHDCLWIEAAEGWDTEPFRKDRSGLQILPDGAAAVVRFVSPGSPAEAAGWKVGDRIVAIDGRPIDPATYGRDLALWGFGPSGTEVRLTLEGGEERILRLAEYY
jgi:C-terminal processing protease CtpA/Prc